MLATTGAPSPAWARASRTSDRWPSCRLPMVGTKAVWRLPASAVRSSARVWITRMGYGSKSGKRGGGSEAVHGFVRVAAVLDGGHITLDRSVQRTAVGQEVAHEARALAGAQPQHVVQHQH